MQTTSYSTCGRHVTELRAVAENEKLCSKCRWRQEHKCPVKGCTTPASRVKLKNIPVRLIQATEVVRGHIFAQFGMPVQLKQCCKVVLYQAPQSYCRICMQLVQVITRFRVQFEINKHE